jgi:hypothetical protein
LSAIVASIWISEGDDVLTIAEFIRESVLRPRLKQAGCLVVYDPTRRYRDLCFDLMADKVRVVDASESSIESREAALLALREVGQPKAALEGVLIYVLSRQNRNVRCVGVFWSRVDRLVVTGW